MARAFGEGASAGDFESNMALMAQYFGRDRVRFFIASNDPDTKRYLQGKFEGSIALFGEDSRSSTGGMQFALMELLVLARTSLILHTFGSTFAMEVRHFDVLL